MGLVMRLPVYTLGSPKLPRIGPALAFLRAGRFACVTVLIGGRLRYSCGRPLERLPAFGFPFAGFRLLLPFEATTFCVLRQAVSFLSARR